MRTCSVQRSFWAWRRNKQAGAKTACSMPTIPIAPTSIDSQTITGCMGCIMVAWPWDLLPLPIKMEGRGLRGLLGSCMSSSAKKCKEIIGRELMHLEVLQIGQELAMTHRRLEGISLLVSLLTLVILSRICEMHGTSNLKLSRSTCRPRQGIHWLAQ